MDSANEEKLEQQHCAPLLPKQPSPPEDHRHHGCPGCHVELLKRSRKGYPVKELILVALVVLCSSLPISSLYPYIYFMVRDFHICKTEDIGYYAGYLGSSFMLGRFLTSVFWGIAADKYGRKPVMIICIFATVIFNSFFGLSKNFWMAMVTRFFLGLFNGLLGPVRAYASEICREEHQAFGLSIVGTMWGVGLIIGPALGGFLAQPAEKFPRIFSESSIFGRFPYFLPSISITIICGGVLLATFWLPETIHKHSLQNEEQYKGYDVEHGREKDSANGESEHSLLKNWAAIASIIIYCVFALHDIAYSEIFDLWTVSPEKYGGLNYTTSDVGVILSITGVGLLVCQLLFFAPFANFAGAILTTRIPIVIGIPVLVLHPFIAMLSGVLRWIAINCASLIKNVLAVATCTGTYLLLNNSVPQSQRGIANGVALTGMSFFKAIGPTAGGSLFAWAEKRQHAFFLPGSHMVFFMLNVVAFVTILLTFEPFLPRSTNEPLSKQDEVARTEQNE